jgi:ribosome-associated heat shock protein Hsp15
MVLMTMSAGYNQPISQPDTQTSYSSMPNENQSTLNEVRLDRWLWAARFFKTRQVSISALKSGRVELNGRKAKPAKMVRVGDILNIRKEQMRFEVTVAELREKRVGADLAINMYTESAQSIETRERLQEQIREQRKAIRFDGGRPSKKDRRDIDRLRRADTD